MRVVAARLPSTLPGLLLGLCVLAGASATGAAEEAAGVVCDQEYALCTSAPCVPDPRDPEKTAVCECVVHRGLSFGNTACAARKARVAGGVTVLASTYSLAEYRTKATMTCPSGAPWTFCLDKPCTVDPMDPLRALCVCAIRSSGEFMTLGGRCDTMTCDTGFWSGASPADVAQGEAAMARALGLEDLPDNACYLESPPG